MDELLSNTALAELFQSCTDSTTQHSPEILYKRLADYFGFASLRDEQKEALFNAVVLRKDMYLQLPTSFGESIVATGSAFAAQYNVLSENPRAKWITLLIVPTKVSI